MNIQTESRSEWLLVQLTAYYIRRKYLSFHSVYDFEYFIKCITEDEYKEVTSDIKAYEASLMLLPSEKLEYLYNKESKQFNCPTLLDSILTPEANADFSYWSKMTTWNLEQAIALLLRKDPRYMNWEKIKNYRNSYFVKTYNDLRELIKNAEYAGEIHNGMRPDKFIEWCVYKEIDVPIELKEHLSKFCNKEELPAHLNPQHPNYSSKLYAAIEAHNHITNNPDKLKGASVKKAANKYLVDNARVLGLSVGGNINKQAIEEISKIVNWKTKGGAPTI